jgi:hypothetical protein
MAGTVLVAKDIPEVSSLSKTQVIPSVAIAFVAGMLSTNKTRSRASPIQAKIDFPITVISFLSSVWF